MDKQTCIAAAGARKTTFLVETALASAGRRSIITTYTIENAQQAREYLIHRAGYVPETVDVETWYTFLLRECVRPYQNYVYDEKRVKNIFFSEGRSAPFAKKSDTRRYYFSNGERIYTDKISAFACACNEASGGLVVKRLEAIYHNVLIDEAQDLAGYDFDLLELLLRSKMKVLIVGDCRQATYFTNCSPKNSKFRGKSIVNLFRHWEKRGLCAVTERNESYRCNQMICNFADRLYPDFTPTISKNDSVTGHDGVFLVTTKDALRYFSIFKPKVLRDSIRTSTLGLEAINFGLSKGKTYPRVLVFPNGPQKRFLTDGDASALKQRTKAGFYVAVTRAKHSVAIVTDEAVAVAAVEGTQQFE